MNNILSKWINFFFIYSFIGWVWESCYVSIAKKKWINRGFLKSPIVPIYGFGAIIILWVTEPFKDNGYLIFFIGMLSTTILEYLTGLVSEKMFNIKLWDYSQHRLNLNGHICLFTSLCWGLLSILLVKFVHQKIYLAVLKIPYYFIEIFSILFLIIYIIDTSTSIYTALNTKIVQQKK